MILSIKKNFWLNKQKKFSIKKLKLFGSNPAIGREPTY